MAMIESKDRATSDPAARKAVLKQIEQEGVEYVLFWFTDIEGHLKSFAITPSEIEGALDDGMGFDGSSITGLQRDRGVGHGRDPGPDLVPDHAGAREGEAKVGRMICDVVKPDGEPYEGDPAVRAAARARADAARSASTRSTSGRSSSTSSSRTTRGTETLDEGGYFAMTALDAATELRNETIKALESVGIGIEYHHHEVAPSQHEIDMRYASALDMADQTITYRLIVKEVAAKHGVYATFMPKPLFGENGSGMHTHMSLFSDGRNQFFDGDDRTPVGGRASSSSPACSATRASSRRCSRSGSTRTSGSCPASRRRSTSPGRSATARR